MHDDLVLLSILGHFCRFLSFRENRIRERGGWFILAIARVGASCPRWQGTGVKMHQGCGTYCSGCLWLGKPGLVAHGPGQSHLETPRFHSQVRGKTKKEAWRLLRRRCDCPDFVAPGHLDVRPLLPSFIQTEEPRLDWRGATKGGPRYEDKGSPGFSLKVHE